MTCRDGLFKVGQKLLTKRGGGHISFGQAILVVIEESLHFHHINIPMLGTSWEMQQSFAATRAKLGCININYNVIALSCLYSNSIIRLRVIKTGAARAKQADLGIV